MKRTYDTSLKRAIFSKEEILNELIKLEDSIELFLADYMTEERKEYDVIKEEALESLLEDYGYTLCYDRDISKGENVDSLFRLLTFLVDYPVKKKVSVETIEYLFKRFNLINVFTFVIFQISDKRLESELIDSYIRYLGDSSIKCLAILFLYRVNQEHIRDNYIIDDIAGMSNEELYYAVATGYFDISDKGDKAIKVLKERKADIELKNLKQSGFKI